MPEPSDLTAVRGAAILFWLIAAGFGVYAFPAAAYLIEHRELPMTAFGFRAYGGGWFERFSPEVFAVLLGVFVGICAVEAFAGWLLWHGTRAGGFLMLALLPVEIVFWSGFAVPIPPVAAVVRLGLLAAAWSALR
ncbi:MAG: hypothetical protein ABI466_02535 [Chloroflexota bacterium]